MGKLAPSPAPAALRSAERERLAAAIERHQNAANEVERIKAAIQRLLREVLFPAEDALVEARKAVVAQEASEQNLAAAVFLGDAVAVDLAATRKAVEDAQTIVRNAERTRAGLDERQKEAQVECERAKAHLDEMVGDVVRADPALAAIIEQFKTSRRGTEQLRQVLLQVLGPYLPRVGVNADYYGFLPEDQHLPDEAAVWKEALAKLRDDPDAELPL